ncbi:hypothetical protein ABZ958_05140 [Streptomyces sp. NPDC046237]
MPAHDTPRPLTASFEFVVGTARIAAAEETGEIHARTGGGDIAIRRA